MVQEKDEDELIKKEMIKKVDKRKLKKLLAMCYNIKDCEVLGLDKMLETWASQKIELYKLFGNELKIEKDICLTKEKIEKIEMEAGNSENGLKEYWNKEFENLFTKLEEISPVISEAMDRNLRFAMLKQQMPEVNGECMSPIFRDIYFKCPSDKMNFSTLMHKIFLSKEVDEEVSKYLQKIDTDITGKMYVSIDPFDFVTMSLNKSNWTSCHSLHNGGSLSGREFGCYSAGIFSYMCDNVSTIAYRTDEEQYKYEFNRRSFFAESKNWRQMIFIEPSKKYFISSRQYPYKSEILAKIIREMVENKIDNIKEVEEDRETDNTITNKWKVSRKCYDNKKLIKNKNFENYDDVDDQEDIEENSEGMEVLHYNDMLHNFEYQFVYQDKYPKSELPIIYIGSNPHCVICGEDIIIRHNIPMCESCAEYYEVEED